MDKEYLLDVLDYLKRRWWMLLLWLMVFGGFTYFCYPEIKDWVAYLILWALTLIFEPLSWYESAGWNLELGLLYSLITFFLIMFTFPIAM